MHRYERFYRCLDELTGGIKDFCAGAHGDTLRIEVPGYMPLSIDRLSITRIAIVHNFIQNGELIPDLDMVIALDHMSLSAHPVAIQDSWGHYSLAEFEHEGQTLINTDQRKVQAQFLDKWFRILREQGFFDAKHRVRGKVAVSI